MRKQMTFTIEGYKGDFVVKELTVQEIINLINMGSKKKKEGEEDGDQSFTTLRSQIEDHFLPLCTNLKLASLLKMAPSDIEEVWNHFQEVNKVFFALARKAGLTEVLDNLKDSLVQDYSKLLASLSSQDILES